MTQSHWLAFLSLYTLVKSIFLFGGLQHACVSGGCCDKLSDTCTNLDSEIIPLPNSFRYYNSNRILYTTKINSFIFCTYKFCWQEKSFMLIPVYSIQGNQKLAFRQFFSVINFWHIYHLVIGLICNLLTPFFGKFQEETWRYILSPGMYSISRL